MINDKTLREKVESYDDSNKDYIAILYVCLEGWMSNDWAIMTVNHDCLCFYVLDNFKMSLVITGKFTVLYEAITKMKISKFLLWTNLKIRSADDSKTYKLKVKVSSKCIGIKKQKENIGILVDFLRSRNLVRP